MPMVLYSAKPLPALALYRQLSRERVGIVCMQEAEGIGEGREWVLKLHKGNHWFALLPVAPIISSD